LLSRKLFYGYEFKVVVTNKKIQAREVILFHNGRGAQEGVFAELKSQGQLDYVPTRTLAGNQIFMLSAVLAHNLNRDLQMAANEPSRDTTPQRSPLLAVRTARNATPEADQQGRAPHPTAGTTDPDHERQPFGSK
jgi:hypothetical protein